MACRDWAAKIGGGVLGRVWALVAAFALLLGLTVLAPAPAQAASFRDVPSGQWYTSWVDKASDQGLMSGFTDPATGRLTGYFGPDEPLTRAQVATVLWRMAGGPSSGHVSFPDVERGSWYDAPVAWCVKAGVVTGYTSGPDRGYFRPDRPVTRQELATMVYRYAKYAGMDVADPDPTAFRSTTDWRTVDSWASEALTWTAAAGVLSGVDNHDGTYSVVPFGTATRAMAAKVFVVLSGSPSAAKASYTVTFDSNGGSAVKVQAVKNGAKASKPASPTKSGYTFKGWYSDKSLTKAYDFGSAVKSNLALYAKWEKKASYTVTFVSNGGSAVKAQTVPSGARASRPADPTRAGHAFKGWYTDKSLTEAYDFGSAVRSDLALYAKWEKKATYTVTFNANGGTAVKAQTVPSGARASRPADPTRAGHAFKGWYTDKSLAEAYDFGSAVRSDLTLYAKWEANEYTVTFVSNGGTSVAKQTVAYGAKASKPSDPTLDGSQFAGWYTDAACTEAYDFGSAVRSDLALYAKWEANEYTVTFVSNGGTSVARQTVAYGAKASKPADPTLDGSQFAGWYTDAACTEAYDFGSAVRSDLALYAKWEKKAYAILYKDGLLSLQEGPDADPSHGEVLGKWAWNGSSRPWYDKRARVRSVVARDRVVVSSGYGMFRDLANCRSMDLSGLDVSGASSLSGMFHGCSSLTSLDVSGWDVSGASDLSSMFSGCSRLRSLDVSGWDVLGASSLSYMFHGCSSLTSLDLSGWDVLGASRLSYMFHGCSSLGTVTLGAGCGLLVKELPNGPWYDAEGKEYDRPPAGVAGTFTKTKPAALVVAADGVSDADALPPAQIVEGEQDGLRYLVVPEGASFEYGLGYPELAGRYVGPGVYLTGYAGEGDSLVVPLEVAGVPVVSANLSWNDSDRAGMTRLASVSFERVEGKTSSLAQLDVSGNGLSSLDIEGLDALVRLNCEGNPIADLAALQTWAAQDGHVAKLPQVQDAAPAEPGDAAAPAEPSAPEQPSEPDAPAVEPGEPSRPEVPAEPGVPGEPSGPEVPAEPEVPSEPEAPATPEVPSEPEEPFEESAPDEGPSDDSAASDEGDPASDSLALGEDPVSALAA